MINKKKLLIFWGPYLFYEALLPAVERLAEKFQVYLIMVESFLSPQARAAANALVDRRILQNLWIVPSPRDRWRDLANFHLFLRSHFKNWRDEFFDVFLTYSGTDVLDHYIMETVLPEKTKKICFSPSLTNLLRDKEYVQKLIGEITEKGEKKQTALHKFRQKRPLSWYVKTLWFYLRSYRQHLGKYIRMNILHRKLLPWLLVGKVFPQVTGDRKVINGAAMDALAFTDAIEARAFSAIFPGIPIHLVRYPSFGVCSCGGEKSKKKNILVPLSTGIARGAQNFKEMVNMLVRDLKIILEHTGGNGVHLRMHPRDCGSWAFDLQESLVKRGLEALCVKSDRPYHEIMCDYLALASLASNSLRDARAACEQALIIGLLGPSKGVGVNIKFWFGEGEGIGWIEEDGSFDPAIFEKKKYVPKYERDIVSVLEEIAYAN